MSNIYIRIYEEIEKNEGVLDNHVLNEIDLEGYLSSYNIELLLRAFQNSKKCLVIKTLSDFSKKKELTQTKKGVYKGSQKLTELIKAELSINEKEDVIAAILEALDNPQNKNAVCQVDNIFITKEMKQFGFLFTFLKLPKYEYKVLFEIHDESQKGQNWSNLLYDIFKDSYTSFENKYL